MSKETKFRIVLDTNIIVAAGSRWVNVDPPAPMGGQLAQQIIYCVASQHVGLICGKIAGEYVEKLIDLNHPLERVSKYVAYLLGAFTRVELTSTSCNPTPADPDDAVFVICALDGEAHFLITDDRHLLALKGSYDPPKIRTRDEMRAPLLLID